MAKAASKRRYGPKAQEIIEDVMHEQKKGKLRSGRSGKKVTSRKQAIAIGLSEAREAGAKVPRAPKAAKTSSRKTTKKSVKTSARKSVKRAAKKTTRKK